jgi:CRISPR-associated endonuclease/helicase Cas3
MSRGLIKFERLIEMERLYYQRAYTDIEIAERLGIDRTTAYRDRMTLEAEIPFVKDDEGRWRIDRTKYLSEIRLNLHEALALYLAARKASQQTHFAQRNTATALEKLAMALRQPMTEKLVGAAERILSQSEIPERDAVMRTLAEAWVQTQKLRIEYLSLSSKTPRTHVVSPYLIEPSPWTDGVYLIGLHELYGDVVPYRVDRILKAVNTGEGFMIPEDFDEVALLRHAWGIWSGSQEPEEVVLRFAPGTASRRLRESIWHPLEKVELQPDGGCLWRAPIAEWQEMLPWIRGWGADVEVLAPAELREVMIRETKKLVNMYDLNSLLEIQDVSPILGHCHYFAHTKDGHDKPDWQCLKDHLANTADLAAVFGRDAGLDELARIAGLMHDIGKYSEAFQSRLEGSKRRVDHSTAGAKEIITIFNNSTNKAFAEILAFCIAGHHTGLPDYGSKADVNGDGTLLARLEKSKLEDYSAYKTDIDLASINLPGRLPIRPIKNRNGKSLPGFSVSFLTRMVYSALVDADYQETETYMQGMAKPRGEYASIEDLCQTFNRFLIKYDNPVGELNMKRTETLNACKVKATEKPGYFTLTVPTGGGKTFASMAFALNHAVKYGMRRIIYVIPFTSIIEQNAAEFKKSLGEANVLEHHSNFDWEKIRKAYDEVPDDHTNSAYSKLRLAAENWDIPIIVTTNVQFFESLFANRSSRCRKLHNLAKSVIIFDEAQMLPREFMDPCMYAVQELVLNYGASVVFCTATQPALERFLAPDTSIIELATNPQELFDFYRRVRVNNQGKLPDNELIEKMHTHRQVLCIVNTRKHAKGLFDGLTSRTREGCFHLSTLMCPVHRKVTLAAIREQLEKGETCRVVSTQVMEAGIDVDFPVGYRSIAGLDSIVQAAGRVNREGKQEVGEIHIFESETPFIKRTPAFVKQGAAVTESILREFKENPVSIEAINAYFGLLYSLQDEKAFDTKEILACFEKGVRELNFDFKTAAEKFNLIDNRTVPVIIPYNQESSRLVEELKHTQYPSSTLRKLQVYTVNIYEQEFENLQNKGVILTIAEQYAVLDKTQMEAYYHPDTGLIIPESGGGDAIFFDG